METAHGRAFQRQHAGAQRPDRANARLRTVAGRHGAVYVDYHRHLAAEDGLTLRPGLADDRLHPHVVGYEIMANVLLDTLSAAGIDVLAARCTM
jgi:lysophospholipase L1-like esterase